MQTNPGGLRSYNEIASINSPTSVELRDKVLFTSSGSYFNIYLDSSGFRGIYITGIESTLAPTNANNENIKIHHNQFTTSQTDDYTSFKRGAGVVIGNNQNARMIDVFNNWFTYCTHALFAANGDFDFHHNFTSQSTVDIYAVQMSLRSRISYNNCEGSRQFLMFGSGAPLTIEHNHCVAGNYDYRNPL